MKTKASELILNKRGAVYHLNLRPEEIGDTIILVGDPGRVGLISKNFDTISFKKKNREFVTHTGIIGNKSISAISTGIGTDNIDIVVNELNMLCNIPNEQKRKLKLVRIGTCGTIQKNIPVNSFIVSRNAVGLDGMAYYYDKIKQDEEFARAFALNTQWDKRLATPYVVEGDKQLVKLLGKGNFIGSTLSATGFYGPQLREVPGVNHELASSYLNRLREFSYNGERILNFEMECSGIYALSKLFGHKACTICCVVANRSTGEFSANYKDPVKKLIRECLSRLTV